MKVPIILIFLVTVLIFACKPYEEYENNAENQRRITQVRNERYKKHSFVGKWQEYKRTNRKAELAFSDTLRYDFFGDSSVHIYDTIGRMKRTKSGRRKRKGFYVGNDNFYKSFYMRDGVMTLGKGKTKYYLKKVNSFYLSPIRRNLTGTETKEIGPLDALYFQGSWKIYKKTDPEFSRKKTYLHKLEIGESNADGTYVVKAFYNAASKIVNDTGKLAVESESITLSVMKQTKSYKLVGAMGDELVLKDGAVVYYMKKIAD